MHCEDAAEPQLTKLSSSRSMPELDRLPWLTDSFNTGRCDDADTSASGTHQGSGSPEARPSSPIGLGPSPAPLFGPFLPDFRPVPRLIYKDLQDGSAVRGRSGFHNLGNTCFMNAGLQCLLSNPRLSQFFLDRHAPDLNDVTLLAKYYQILHKVWQGKYSVLNLSEFKRTLGLYHPQFQDYRQHDCQEFLALVLDSLHEELNVCPSSNKLRLQAPPTSAVVAGPSTEETSGAQLPAAAASPEIKNQLSGSMVDDYDAVDESEVTSTQPLGQSSAETEPKVTGVQEPTASPLMNTESGDSQLTEAGQSQHVKTDTPLEIKATPQPSSLQEFTNSRADDTDQSDSSSQKESLEYSAEVAGDKDASSLTNAHRKFPTLEDLYMKDTKVLNVNMLATEFEVEEVALGSVKYHKPDNRNPRVEEDLEDTEIFMEDVAGGEMNEVDLLEFEAEKGAPLKPLKETNLLANHKEKFSDDPYGKKLLFSEYCEDEGEPDCSINNIKRIKIDEEVEKKEKNLCVESFLKSSNLDRCKQEVRIDTCAAGFSAGTSSSQAGSSSVGGATAWRDSAENNANLVDDHRLKQLSPQSNQSLRSQAELPGMSPPPQLPFNNEAYMWGRYNAEADREWKRYLEKNQSVIVETFQGQFKSTVVCSECHHVSVTFEPFMYLSVPIPHAMDRQISVIFVPCDNKQPVRYLLTLHKNDKIGKMVKALRGLIKEESCDLVVAEVFDNHIARILDDQVLLRYVNDESRTIYAFEMLPAPTDVVAKLHDSVDKTETGQPSHTVPNNAVSSSYGASLSQPLSAAVTDNRNNSADNSPSATAVSITTMATQTGNDPALNTHKPTGSVAAGSSEQEILNNTVCGATANACSHSNLELRNDIHWQTNLLNPENGEKIMDTDFSTSSFVNFPADAKRPDGTEAGCGKAEEEVGGGDGMNLELGGDSNDGSGGGGEQTECSKWRSCAICLEDMMDAELMIHAECGGTLCHNCLDMSFKHYGDAGFMCPVCSTAVAPAEDFIQLDCMADYKPKTRILPVPVLQRHHEAAASEGEDELSMFGHPNVLYLPSELSGELLYNHVDRVVSVLANYTIVLTDGQGLHCCRCLYTSHCSGCPVTRDADVTLHPGDHLTVCFSGLDIVQRVNAGTYEDHKSVEEMRSKYPLTLSDCFTAFTQSERLDEHNPWYCPRCCKNQCANKTMTVWRFPQTLVVYLKRFVFHDLMSTKIENKVVFPLDNLDLYHFISGPKNTNLTYSLQSCVCHFGSVNSGHYTAYAKHPTSDAWHYYNDEQISEKQPEEAEYSSAYILFYQKKGEDISVKVPEMDREATPLRGGTIQDIEMTDGCQSCNADPWLTFDGPASGPPLVLNNAKRENTDATLPDSTSTGFEFYN